MQGITGCYEFGEFRLDVESRLLWRAGEQVALTPKEFDVLLVLVENAGRVVTKDELLEAVWKDTFIEEATLVRNVSWLRKKLAVGDDAGSDAAKLIETLPKRGYRFSAQVVRRDGRAALAVVEAHAPAAVAEEHTLTRVHVRETITVRDPEPPVTSPSVAYAPAASPLASLPAPRASRHKKLLMLAFAFGAIAAALGFALYRGIASDRGQKVVLLGRVAPFSGSPGRENFPAFSPDGKLLAFVWNGGAGDNFDLYVKQIGAGAPVRLTETEADEVNPTFSPDGSQVAFVRLRAAGSEVFVVPALGGAERKICDVRPTYSRLSFSPDGGTLLVADADADGDRQGIFAVEAATGAKRRLTTPPETTKDIGARFSPDGERVLFLRDFDGGVNELFVMPASDEDGGASARQLTSGKTSIPGFAWSADGERVIYASRTSALTSELRQIDARGGASSLIVTNIKNATNPAFNADGRTLAFVEESFGTNIWRLEVAAAIVASDNLALARKLIESSRDDNSPVFSPDDRHIAFISNRTGSSEVWIADADGAHQRQITGALRSADATAPGAPADLSAAGSPRFSPDGKLILYDAQRAGNGDIYVVPTEGGAPRRLTSDASQEALPSWSADGRWVYFASNRAGEFDLWRMPLAGGEAVRVTRGGGFESAAAPDGRTIFYTKARGVAGLWRVPVEGGEEAPMPELADAGYWRYWTVTPAGIYFVARSSAAPYRIMFYDFVSRQSTRAATTDKPPIWTYPGLSVSADGRTILYSQYAQSASSIMLAGLSE